MRKETPMTKRSKAKVYFICHFLACIGLLSLGKLIGVLNNGDTLGLVDVAYDIGEDNLHLAIEYDDGFYHDENRVEGDRTKTRRLLREYPDLIIGRIRLAAPRLDMKDAWLVVAHTNDRHHGRAVKALAQELAKKTQIPENLRKALRNADGNNNKKANEVAEEFFILVVTQYKASINELAAEVGQENAQRVLNTTGVKSRITAIVNALKLVWAELRLSSDQLVRLMCGGVASALCESPEAFWADIKRLHSYRIGCCLRNSYRIYEPT